MNDQQVRTQVKNHQQNSKEAKNTKTLYEKTLQNINQKNSTLLYEQNKQSFQISEHFLSYMKILWGQQCPQINILKCNEKNQSKKKLILKYKLFLQNKKLQILQKFNNCQDIRISVQQNNKQIQIQYESRTSKFMNCKVFIGIFQVDVSILNLDSSQSSISQGLQIIGKGAFAQILEQKTHKYIVKKTYFNNSSNLTNNRYQILKKVIFQFAIVKILSYIGLGIKHENLCGFQILCFHDYVQFFLQRGFQIEQKLVVQQKSRFKQIMFQNLRILHLLQIVHLDVKPNNILYSSYHKKFVFIDFNISQCIMESIGYKTFTSYKGTFNYMGKQMLNSYFLKQKSSIDLYWNDVQSLIITFQNIQQMILIKKNQNVYFWNVESYQNLQLKEIKQDQIYTKIQAKSRKNKYFTYQKALFIFLLNKNSNKISFFQQKIGSKSFKQLIFSSLPFLIQYEANPHLQKNYKSFFMPYLNQFSQKIRKKIQWSFQKRVFLQDQDIKNASQIQARYQELNKKGKYMERLISASNLNESFKSANFFQNIQVKDNEKQQNLYICFVRYIYCNIGIINLTQIMKNVVKFNEKTQFKLVKNKSQQNDFLTIYQILQNLVQFFFKLEKKLKYYLIIQQILEIYYHIDRYFPATYKMHEILQNYEQFFSSFKKIIYHYILFKAQSHFYSVQGDNHKHKEKIIFMFKSQELKQNQKNFTQLLIIWMDFLTNQHDFLIQRQKFKPQIYSAQNYQIYKSFLENNQSNYQDVKSALKLVQKLKKLINKFQHFKNLFKFQYFLILHDISMKIFQIYKFYDAFTVSIKLIQNLITICLQNVKGPSSKYYLQNIYQQMALFYQLSGFQQKCLYYAKLSGMKLFQKIITFGIQVKSKTVEQKKLLLKECIEQIKNTSEKRAQLRLSFWSWKLIFYAKNNLPNVEVQRAIKQLQSYDQFPLIKKLLNKQKYNEDIRDHLNVIQSKNSKKQEILRAKYKVEQYITQSQNIPNLNKNNLNALYWQSKCAFSLKFESPQKFMKNLQEFKIYVDVFDQPNNINFWKNIMMNIYSQYKIQKCWEYILQIYQVTKKKYSTLIYVQDNDNFVYNMFIFFVRKKQFQKIFEFMNFVCQILYDNKPNDQELVKFYIKKNVAICSTYQFKKVNKGLLQYMHLHKLSRSQMKFKPQICMFYYFIIINTFQKDPENNVKVLKQIALMKDQLTKISQSIIKQNFYKILFTYNKKYKNDMQKCYYFYIKCCREPKCSIFFPQTTLQLNKRKYLKKQRDYKFSNKTFKTLCQLQSSYHIQGIICKMKKYNKVKL